LESASTTNKPKDWINILFLTLTPIFGIPVLAWYTWYAGFSLWMLVLFVVSYSLVGLSICAGYHRYFAHKSYECASLVQVFLAVLGAMAAQNSILRWASGHRRHHAHAESEWDPYAITRGFWWAHIIWIFYPTEDRFSNVRDLMHNPIVRWQHRWYTAIVLSGFVLPALIGWFCGDWIAGLLWGGFLRIVVVHHSTFMVNSLAHHVGERTYDEEATARDNWAVALLTFGEGYHSFHHRFPADFRNGVRWYAWDPAKWFIRTLQICGLAHKLNETEAPRIEHARVKTRVKELEKLIAGAEHKHGAEIRERIQRVRESFDAALALWHKQAEERSQGLSDSWRETRRHYRARLKEARRDWNLVLLACKRLTTGQ